MLPSCFVGRLFIFVPVMLKFVWFDLGYTLVHTRRELYFQKMLLQYGKNPAMDEIAAGYHRTNKLFMREYILWE